ncbi:MAG: hypothetical protein Kow0010_27210 [Dehalococcoidia bacterium]
MPFTREEIEAFLDALRSDAELRERAREIILDDDFRALPGIIRSLGERVDRLGERIEELVAADAALAERMDQLTARVDQLAERMDQLTVRMDQLAERMDQLTVRVDQLAERMDQLTVRMDQLAQRFDWMAGKIGNLEGWQFEHRYIQNLSSRLGPYYRNVRVMALPDEDAVVHALESGELTEREYRELLDLDVVARARPREGDEEVILAIELSVLVDVRDVRRAHDRGEVLARVFSQRVDAIAAGEAALPGASVLARELNVLVVAAGSESAS